MLQRTLVLLSGDLSPVLGADPGAAAPAAPVTAAEGVVQAAAAAPPPDAGFNIWWMYGIWALVIVGFYFLTIRPQRKRDKQMKEMQSSIGVGDNVVTNSGMFGRVAEIGHDCFIVEFGTNRGVRIPIRKADVVGIKTPQLTAQPDKDA